MNEINEVYETCIKCGAWINPEYEHAETYSNGHICDNCVESWDIIDLLDFLNYQSVFEILYALKRTG
jgi:hypothetical protein